MVVAVFCYVVMCSWDEMANYDLPALLNYVLNVTSHEKLFYVGHSQGALIAFARLSHDHVLASKVHACLIHSFIHSSL